MREAMGESALRLAGAVGYEGAGTCEFLLDPDGSFFFLEVNARLQVEHPVTEAVTGLDLVEQQLLVAAGEPLAFSQADVRLDGHAIEVRLVAEDAAADFLPSTGRITAFDVPSGVRVDTGVEAGEAVSPFYDSLLAKLIAHGPTREDAIVALAAALDATRLEGVATNLDLLAAVIAEPAFRSGDLHTGFLDEHRLVARLSEVDPRAVAAAAAARSLVGTEPRRPERDELPAGDGPWHPARPWRLAGVGEATRWVAGGRVVDVRTDRVGPGAALVHVGGTAFDCRVTGGDGGQCQVAGRGPVRR